VAAGSWDGKLQILDAETGGVSTELPGDASVRAAAWGPNGQVAVGNGEVLSLANALGKIEHTVEHDDDVSTVAWSPTQAKLATGSWDGHLRFIDAETGEVAESVEHYSPIASVAWNPSGDKLTTGTWDGSLRVIDVTTAKVERVMKLDAALSAVEWNPNNRPEIASGSEDGHMRIVDAGSGNVERTSPKWGTNVSAVSWSPGF
jgi:WD40 repeat protein